MELIGIDRVLANLNKEIKGIAGRSAAGLTEAGLFIKGEAIKRTPIDTGNLRNSSYVIFPRGNAEEPTGAFVGPSAIRVMESTANSINNARGELRSDPPWAPAVVVGFGAFYAVFVHEIKKGYRKGDWKFLESAIADNSDRILKIIRDKAKV